MTERLSSSSLSSLFGGDDLEEAAAALPISPVASTDDSYWATAALVAFLRTEADLAEHKAKRLRSQAAALAAQFGVTNPMQEQYEIDPGQLAPLDENGVPKYKGKKRGRKPKFRKRKQNPNRRKRQHTAYTLFVKETYPTVKAANASLPSKDVISIVAKRWADDVSAAEKLEWKARALATHDDDDEEEEEDHEDDDEEEEEEEDENDNNNNNGDGNEEERNFQDPGVVQQQQQQVGQAQLDSISTKDNILQHAVPQQQSEQNQPTTSTATPELNTNRRSVTDVREATAAAAAELSEGLAQATAAAVEEVLVEDEIEIDHDGVDEDGDEQNQDEEEDGDNDEGGFKSKK